MVPIVDRIHMTYRRRLLHPVDEAYAWLTDYDDQDAERAGAIIQARKPIERDENTVVLEGHLSIFGQDRRGHAEVALDPPDHWTANLYDPKGRLGDIYDYHLEARADGRESELVIDYAYVAPKLKHKLMLRLLKPLIRRKVDQMWDGFVAAMDQELAGEEALTMDDELAMDEELEAA